MIDWRAIRQRWEADGSKRDERGRLEPSSAFRLTCREKPISMSSLSRKDFGVDVFKLRIAIGVAARCWG
jgi:hypothetical protein